MKKVVLGFLALTVVLSTVIFTSCSDKIISPENKVDDHKTAKLIIRTGIKKGTTETEYKPMAGESKVILKADNSSINWSNSASGKYEQVVELNGDKIEIDVPVNAIEGTEYSADCVDFTADFTTPAGNKLYVYQGSVAFVDGMQLNTAKLMPGQVYTIHVRYNGANEAKVK